MKDRWSQLSMSEKSDLMSLYIQNGISSLEEIKKHYNSFADGGRVDNNSDKDPVLKDRKPKANFYQRLLNPFRQTMPDWENRINGKNRVATHKLSWVTDDNGNAIVYPNVQEINDKLYDFTDPRNKAKKWDALDRAIQTGDTIQMTPAQANFWTQHYKEFYPSFNFATGGHLYEDGGPDDDKTFISSQASETGWMPEIKIEAERPSWQRGLTNYDWARARQYYSNPDGTLTPRGFEFLKNVASKNRTGTSNYMRDVNKLSYIPNAAMLGAGALSGAAFNPYLWSAIGLASGAQNIEDKNYKEAALDLGLTLSIPAARPVVKMINTAVESTKFGKAARTAAEINKAINKTKFTNKEPYLNVGWAPKQDINVYHASNEPLTIENLRFPDYNNWAVSKGAPADIIYLAEGDKPVSGFLTQRPYLQQWEVSLNKPMIQVGEIPTETKNLTRGKLLKQAQSQGADAMIFDGIADNQMKNQRIVADFTKENLNNRASSIRLNREYVPTLDQAVQEAEDAYVRNNPLAFVHEIEDMQLLNAIRAFNGRRGSPSLGISRFDANGNAYTGYGNVRFYFPKEYIKGLKSYSWSDDALLPTTSDAIREAERRGIKLKYTEDGEALISPELESQLKIELLKDHPHLNKRDKNLETSIKNIRVINSPSHYGEVYPLEPVDLSKALYVQTSETYPTLTNWLKLNGIQYGTEVPAILDKRVTFKNGGKLN